VPEFETMLALVRQLGEHDISHFPTPILQSLAQQLNQLPGLIEQVRQFSLKEQNPSHSCQTIQNRVSEFYDAIVPHLLTALSYVVSTSTTIHEIEKDARELYENLAEKSESFRKQAESSQSQIEAALSAIQDQAAKAGVSEHAALYALESDSFRTAAMIWMGFTITAILITLGATFIVVWAVVNEKFVNATTPVVIQFVAAKVLVFSVLSFATVWCARNYRSCRHNQVLNRHRANSLGTFQTFLEGTSDAATKNAILALCAESAFGHRATGYEKHDGGDAPVQIVNPVIDLLGKGQGG